MTTLAQLLMSPKPSGSEDVVAQRDIKSWCAEDATVKTGRKELYGYGKKIILWYILSCVFIGTRLAIQRQRVTGRLKGCGYRSMVQEDRSFPPGLSNDLIPE